jgi:hypothetical protein
MAKECVYPPKPVTEVMVPLPPAPAPPVEPTIRVPEPTKEELSPKNETATIPKKPRRLEFKRTKPAKKKVPFEPKKEDLTKDLPKEFAPPKK